MPTFEYVALDQTGKQTRGSLIAETAVAARHQLRNQNLHVTQVNPISDVMQSGLILGRFFSRNRRRRDVLEFTRQLSTMIKSNIRLAEALAVLTAQTSNEKLSQVVQNIRDQVMAGDSFADCLKQFSSWFDPIYISMVRVGEVTGNLARSLGLLADYMSKRQRIENKIKSALVYPKILVVFSIFVMLFLMTVVVPRLTKIIEAQQQEIPAITQFVMWFSNALIHTWWVFIVLWLLGWWLFRKSVATPKGRMAFDRFQLKVPILGELLRQSVVARFTSTLAALIRSGMPMADSLQVVAEVTGNAVMTQAVRSARERIMAGADVATPLRESGVVDIATAHMISVGERTGEIEEMLLSISDSIEENTAMRVERLSAVIEPVVIVVMAGAISFILLATMMPILQVSNIT